MKTFAYIVSPLTIKQLKDYLPAGKVLPEFLIKPFLKNTRPFVAAHFKKIKSMQEKEIDGFTVVCPILTRHLGDDSELNLVLDAMRLAQEHKADIIGLSGYAAALADKRYFSVTKKIALAVTSGNAFTAWALFEQAYRLSKSKGLALNKITVAVTYAAGTVGYLASRKLSEYAAKLIICDRDKESLAKLKEIILHLNPIEIIIEDDLESAVRGADLVVNAGSEKIEKGFLKKDALLIEGALVTVPGIKNPVPADLAEVMLLALDEKLVNYSLGETINIDKLEEIADIAVQHGFEVWAPDAPVL